MPDLTRSQIEESIHAASDAFARFGLKLPPWATFGIDRWHELARDPAYDEIRDCMLGWDVTDFGSGDFENIGRVLFTVRNGKADATYPKGYSQKYLFDPEHQRAPAHFHRSKREDICCLAGGNILVQLTGAGPDDRPTNVPLTVAVDGVARTVEAGGLIRLEPGQSVHIPPRTIHQFWGEEGTGLTVSSEVSSVCDDWQDNFFLEDAQRFPKVEEDAPRKHCLCNEYPKSS